MKKILFCVLFSILLICSVVFLIISQFMEISTGFRIFIIIYQILFYVLILIINIIFLINKVRKKKEIKKR